MYKKQERLQVRIRDQVFDEFGPIPTLTLLKTFKTASDSKEISDAAAMWLIHQFMKEQSNVVLFSRLQL